MIFAGAGLSSSTGGAVLHDSHGLVLLATDATLTGSLVSIDDSVFTFPTFPAPLFVLDHATLTLDGPLLDLRDSTLTTTARSLVEIANGGVVQTTAPLFRFDGADMTANGALIAMTGGTMMARATADRAAARLISPARPGLAPSGSSPGSRRA